MIPCLRMCKVVRTVRPKAFSQCASSGPPWSVIFFGSDNFSLSSLQMLHKESLSGNYVKNLSVVCACMKCPVAQYSAKNKIRVLLWKKEDEKIKQEKADVGLVVSFGHLIPQSMISAFDLGMVNVHASALPRWRGAAPIIHAVLNGDQETGVTLMKIRPHHFDCGEIIHTAKIPVAPDETALSVTNRLADLGAVELQKCLQDLIFNLNQAKPQPEEGVTYAPKVDDGMSACLWDQCSASRLYRTHLALGHVHPLHTDWHGQQVKILDCRVREERSEKPPGSITFSKRLKQLEVTCSGGSVLSVLQLKVAGRKPLTAMDFVNGFLKRVPFDQWRFGLIEK